MTCVIVQHQVSNFDIWEKAYKKDKKRRVQAGVSEKLLLRDAGDPNSITVVFSLKNEEKARAFFMDTNTADLMKNAGVTSPPNFTYFQVSNSGIAKGESFLIVQHTVQDFDVWKKAFDKHSTVRDEYHLSLIALGKDIDNPKNIVTIMSSTDTSNISNFLEKSDIEESMKNAGVTSEPKINILVANK